MAGPTKSLAGEESWQLSDDDLFAPLPDIIRLGGNGPFVINLSASTMPIGPPPKGLFGGFNAHAYQVQRVEDGRLRYRLRLGPFATEDGADAVLPAIRTQYPGALIARADAEDLRTIAKFPVVTPIAAAQSASLQAAGVAAPVKVAVQTEVAKLPAMPAAAVAKPQAPIAVAPVAAPFKAAVEPTAIEPPFILSLMPDEPKPAPPELAAAVTAPSQAPRPTSAPGSMPAPTWSRATPPPARSTPVPESASPAQPVLTSGKTSRAGAGSAAVTKQSIHLPTSSPAHRSPESQPSTSVPTTQTVRALTTLELEDDKASRWFVIQLAMAGEAFEPDSVPNLDIFSAYQLYSVAGIDQGRIVHVLRLGFFTNDGAARAVASYLESFYEKPTIRRVSYAEHQRFAAQSMAPRKDVGATGKQAVIEITNERFVRASRSVQSPK